jgi:hypothetical protein
LLLPFTVLTYYLATGGATLRLKYYLMITLGGVVALMASTSSGLTESWDRAAKLAQANGAYVWAYFLLIAALVVILLKVPVNTGLAPAGEQI